jgi:hypothetical protein
MPLSALGRNKTVALWAIAIMVCCLRPLLSERGNGIYPVFSRSGHDWFAGADLYPGVGEPFRYLPGMAAMFAPLALVPDAVGGSLWRGLNAAVFLAGLAWFSRACLAGEWQPARLALLFLLTLPLCAGNLNNGQLNPLMTGVMLAGVAAVVGQRWNVAAGLLALACVMKVYPLALAMLLIGLYPLRLGPRFALALGLLLVAPFALQEPHYVADQYALWVKLLPTQDRHAGDLGNCPRDLWLLVRNCGVTPGQPVMAGTSLGAGLGMLGLCLLGRRAGWSPRRLAVTAFALGCCWMTVFNHVVEGCTYVVLAPVLAWGLIDAWERPWPTLARWLCGASVAVLGGCIVVGWFPIGKLVRSWGVQPAAGLVLLVALVLMLVRDLFHRQVAGRGAFPSAPTGQGARPQLRDAA